VGVLDGDWEVERVSGALPPLAGVRKRIAGDRGVTTLGRLRFPFVVDGLELRYSFPPGLVDVLQPEGDGFVGRTRLFGRELGRFRLVKPR
jgi:hypothetical protein